MLPFVALLGCSSTMFDRKLDGVFGIVRDDAQEAVVPARLISQGIMARERPPGLSDMD